VLTPFVNGANVGIEADIRYNVVLEAAAPAADAAFQALEAVLLSSLSVPLRDPQIAACSESIRSNSSLD
jgi:hypothetical protein